MDSMMPLFLLPYDSIFAHILSQKVSLKSMINARGGGAWVLRLFFLFDLK